MNPSVRIRAARESDLRFIKGLLESSSLPTAGIEKHLATFFVAELDRSAIGAMGWKSTMDLLRSAVVSTEHRGLGVGAALYDAVLNKARALDVPRLVLFTTTAESYFRVRGFRREDVSTIAGPVTSSLEFSGACPSTATCMVLDL